MKLYLVQHGEATSKKVNSERPLTANGREAVSQVAQKAVSMGLAVGQIRHSGKTRAEETAEILGQHLQPAAGVVAVDGLGPVDKVGPVAKSLTDQSYSLMLVGHLPFMARLASRLVVGNPNQAVVKFQNAAIVCLTHDDDQWQVDWILTPDMTGA